MHHIPWERSFRIQREPLKLSNFFFYFVIVVRVTSHVCRTSFPPISCFLGALRPRRRDGLLGTGTEWEGDDRVKARPQKPPEKDRCENSRPHYGATMPCKCENMEVLVVVFVVVFVACFCVGCFPLFLVANCLSLGLHWDAVFCCCFGEWGGTEDACTHSKPRLWWTDAWSLIGLAEFGLTHLGHLPCVWNTGFSFLYILMHIYSLCVCVFEGTREKE